MDEVQLQAIDCERIISGGTELATLAALVPHKLPEEKRHMKTFIRASLPVLSVFIMGASAQASVVTVTPADVGPPALNSWYLDNYRSTSNGYTSTTKAAITNANPHLGNGSVQMSLTDGSGKADYVYTWGFVPGRTLGNLDTLSYDWYRDGNSNSPSHLQPALRLYYDADGSSATLDDQGYLIFEQVYNGATLSDQWVSSNIIGSKFWMREFSPGLTIPNYNITLSGWANGAHPDGADLLSANTAILGIEFGIGSGWNGTFSGAVDNVRFGFAGQDATTFNFETANAADVPEPASLALIGLGLLGVAAQRRRKS
jgi:hypothetical protein